MSVNQTNGLIAEILLQMYITTTLDPPLGAITVVDNETGKVVLKTKTIHLIEMLIRFNRSILMLGSEPPRTKAQSDQVNGQ